MDTSVPGQQDASDAALVDMLMLEAPVGLALFGSDLRFRWVNAALTRLAEGAERVREVAAAPELRRLLGRETRPGPDISDRQAIERFLEHAAVHYYHPAGTCKMGPASDPDAVVGSTGQVHGIDGLYVADASIMPAVTSGNTNMPTTVIGERIAQSLLSQQTAR